MNEVRKATFSREELISVCIEKAGFDKAITTATLSSKGLVLTEDYEV